MSVIYGSAAAPVVYRSHYGGIAGSGYFSRKQLKRAIKYGSYLGGAALGALLFTLEVDDVVDLSNLDDDDVVCLDDDLA